MLLLHCSIPHSLSCGRAETLPGLSTPQTLFQGRNPSHKSAKRVDSASLVPSCLPPRGGGHLPLFVTHRVALRPIASWFLSCGSSLPGRWLNLAERYMRKESGSPKDIHLPASTHRAPCFGAYGRNWKRSLCWLGLSIQACWRYPNGMTKRTPT